MRINEKPLQPWVIVSSDGSIESAHCTCMAGLGECCSHTAAVLFALETAARLRGEATVTDTSAYWKFPSATRFDSPYVRIKDMDLQSANKKRKTMVEVTKPNPEVSTTTNNVPSPTKAEENDFFRKLSCVMPKASVLSLTEGYSDKFVPKSASKDWPKDLSTIYDSKIDSSDYDKILTHCDDINIEVTQEQVKLVENETRDQSESSNWHRLRVGRITASNLHSATHTDLTKPSHSLLQTICNPTAKSFKTAATEWGKKNEQKARIHYVNIMKETHENFQCTSSGLCLSSEYPQFGASPDGFISCDCCGNGCLEIKCPYSQKESDTELKYIIKRENGMELDRTHPYYSQIQMQLFITGKTHCDFMVWNPRTVLIERIKPDHSFWEVSSRKALLFHKHCVMPELCANYFTNKKLAPSKVVNTNVDNSKTVKFCICGGDDDGRKMIACENENCKFQWYHTCCIKMKRVPKGKWICKYCKSGKSY